MSGWNEEDYAVEDAMEMVESVQEADEQAEASLSEAVKRIEEANLFKLLIKQPVFAEGSASPEILLSVNAKIKQFAVNELNTLLGISKPEPKEQVSKIFDTEEVQALKLLAAKVLKRDPLEALSKAEPRVPTMNSIGQSEAVTPKLSVQQNKQVQQNQIKQRPDVTKSTQKAVSSPPTAPQQEKKSGDSSKPKRNVGKIKPVPQASYQQVAQMLTAPTVNMTQDSLAGTDGQAMSNFITKMVGGGSVVADTSAHTKVLDQQYSEDDINERF